jgi:hypothetical protein
MPHAVMTRDGEAEQMDTYAYTFASMPTGKHYIKWFEPKADMSVVHHMLLFGKGAHSLPGCRVVALPGGVRLVYTWTILLPSTEMCF